LSSAENELTAEQVVHNTAHHDEHHEVGHMHRDDEGSKLGMWLFLFTEILLFGGLFILYSAYRFAYPEGFVAAASEMNTFLGAINTLVLLTSSLTVALSIAALQRGQKRLATSLLWFTLLCGLIFLVNKYFEWGHEIGNGIYPKGPALDNMSSGEIIYFGLYFTMTGLHGLHIIVGMIFIGFILNFIYRDKITATNYQKLENAGLYWHLVDLIWIFLFPLFYLIH
jgi:cytochrome c oxidase subunit III